MQMHVDAPRTRPITVTTQEAARLLGLSPATLRNWRCQGKGPRYIHIGGKTTPVLYRYDDLDAWAQSLK